MNGSNVAAITGGAGALGSAVASALVAEGYTVALLDTERGRGRAAELVQKLGAERALAHCGDFATRATWDEALAAITRAFGTAPTHGVLVAGGWEGGAPLHEAREETHAKMMSSNVDTAYRAMRALLPAMVEAKRGALVVIGSRAVERPWASTGAASYGAAKAAVVAMAQAAAAEVLASGVRINAVLPSTMDTPANRSAMPGVDPATWVSLESAAGVIRFLLSDAARDVSGAAIPVYGRA